MGPSSVATHEQLHMHKQPLAFQELTPTSALLRCLSTLSTAAAHHQTFLSTRKILPRRQNSPPDAALLRAPASYENADGRP